jgi:hypothetical protein
MSKESLQRDELVQKPQRDPTTFIVIAVIVTSERCAVKTAAKKPGHREIIETNLKKFYDLVSKGQWQNCLEMVLEEKRSTISKLDYARNILNLGAVGKLEISNLCVVAPRTNNKDSDETVVVHYTLTNDSDSKKMKEAWIKREGQWYMSSPLVARF